MRATLVSITPDADQHLAEMASICYDSDTSDKARNERRLQSIIRSGHLSVLRFANATVRVSGISRACSHQLVRHKHLDYLQRSQRYCDESATQFVEPDSMERLPHELLLRIGQLQQEMRGVYRAILDSGGRQEDARYWLPNASSTELLITGNFQAWRDFLRLRLERAAQWEIRQAAEQIRDLLLHQAPISFADFGLPTK